MKNSTTYKIVQAMKATGNRPGVIAQWKSLVETWAANEVNNPDAVAVRAWLPLWQVRQHYTAAELAPLWPVLGIVLGITKRLEHPKSAKRLEHELDYGGLPWFKWEGRKYYIVERVHHWKAQVALGNWQEINHAFNG